MITIIPGVILMTLAATAFAFAQEENKVTFTAYYPSPHGEYQTVRVSPGSAPSPSDCTGPGSPEGKIYYDQSSHELKICTNSSGTWGYYPLGGSGGYWDLNGENLTVSNTTWNVGIGTTAPEEKLQVMGYITLGHSQAAQKYAVAGEENFRIVRGTVASSGAFVSGSGFQSSESSKRYYVQFNESFSEVPSCSAAGWTNSSDPGLAVTISSNTTSQVVFAMYDEDVGIGRRQFDFICIGPR